MSAPVLSRRALNRATLARQSLLERSDLSVLELTERLGGLQSQTPHTWYVGYWSRLAGVRGEDVSALLESRALVRVAMMRSTIHLVTARDALALRPAIVPVLVRGMQGNYGKNPVGVDPVELAEAGRVILDEEPLLFGELGRRLAAQWPDRDPMSLAQGVRTHLALAQVTPRGLWKRSGKAAHAPLESWLGRKVGRGMKSDELVRRYLAAFGPATVKDAQQWSGLTRLAEVFERLRPSLVTFADEQGRELFDLPDSPRPGEDVDAPARLLYDYDNLFLSHDDRSRVVTQEYRAVGPTFSKNGMQPRIVLVDGMSRGHWTIANDGGAAVVSVIPFAKKLTTKDAAAVRREAVALAAFLEPDADDVDVRFEEPLG